MTVGTVISYCTNDFRFLGKCIAEAKKFSSEIIVAVSDHFFDGTPENRSLLEATYQNHPDCKFIEFAYSPDKLYSEHAYTEKDSEWPKIWHSTARYIGFLHLNPKTEWVLFLDSDEIVEGDLFASALQREEYKKWNAIRFDGYLYVHKAHIRAKIPQRLSLLAKYASVKLLYMYQLDERAALFSLIEGPKALGGTFQGRPIFHHYSWVRSKAECLKKAASWGHKADLDWELAIETGFQGGELQRFFGKEFAFEEIEAPFFDPLAISLPTIKKQQVQNVVKIGPKEVFRKEIETILFA